MCGGGGVVVIVVVHDDSLLNETISTLRARNRLFTSIQSCRLCPAK